MTTRPSSFWKARIFVLSAVVLLLLGSCAKPPVREMSEAQRSLDEARSKGADTYASELYLKAEGAIREARSLVAEKEYEKAKKLAETVSKLALQASVMAETTKASLREEAERRITEAEQGISRIRTWTVPRNMKKRFERLRPNREAELEGWEADLVQAKARLSEEKIGDATLLSEKVLKGVSSRIEALQAMVARWKKRSR